jgi:hypothetical protein
LKATRARHREAASAPTPLCLGSRVSGAGSPCGFTRPRRPRPIGLDRNASDPPPSLGGVAVGRFTCSCPRLAPPGAGRGRRPRRPRPLAGGQRGGDRLGCLVLLLAAFGPTGSGRAPCGGLRGLSDNPVVWSRNSKSTKASDSVTWHVIPSISTNVDPLDWNAGGPDVSQSGPRRGSLPFEWAGLPS